MWFATSSVDSLTRTRIAVAVISTAAAISLGYYTYQNNGPHFVESLPPGHLRRSNAVRDPSSSHRRTSSRASSDAARDENEENTQTPAAPEQGDGETIIDDGDDWWNEPGYPAQQRTGHNIVNLLFRVSEDNARRNGCVHRGCQCNSCGMVPIRGVRYRCANCADFDLCETCESQGVHIKTHIFYKIRVPAPPFGPRQMQPVWYTGDPDTCLRSLPRHLIPRLSRETGFERPELEAFWEQWTFIANTEWRDDPDELGIAMDRKTFERCLVPTGGSRHAEPNLIHDRMFSFYDTNHDELIGFTEFLYGLSYRKRRDKLRTVFEGYDIDGDGYVDRRDFLRMFRAYYVLYKQMHKDILDGLEDQLLESTEAQQLVASRQPLSSLFGREGRVPDANNNLHFEGKTFHVNGETDVEEGKTSVIAENRGDVAPREDILTSLFACGTLRPPRRRLITGTDADDNYRIVRRLSTTETDRTYWLALLEQPSSLEELPDIVLQSNRSGGETEDEMDESLPDSDSPNRHEMTDSEWRVKSMKMQKKHNSASERRRRDMARKQLHDRWRRRQFYLDEEEGGSAPEDWQENEDILAHMNNLGEDSKAAGSTPESSSSRSRSDSKVRFADDAVPPDAVSNSYGSSKPKPNGQKRDLTVIERDSGKEILYQVTQQAFNELLDAIFKSAEDLAVEVAKTKEEREKHASEIEKQYQKDQEELRELEETPLTPVSAANTITKPIEQKSLDELLQDSGYSVAEDKPRNAVDLSHSEVTIHEDSQSGDDAAEVQPGVDQSSDFVPGDATWPQFRPNSAADISSQGEEPQLASDKVLEPEPAVATLRYWARLNEAEDKAKARKGWGKLSFEEFEEIYKQQEMEGNRLDYLGSWIDFCIP